jgi:hypothetical protein
MLSVDGKTSSLALARLRKAAEQAVDEVQARVASLNQSGGLSAVNKAYRSYRL